MVTVQGKKGENKKIPRGTFLWRKLSTNKSSADIRRNVWDE